MACSRGELDSNYKYKTCCKLQILAGRRITGQPALRVRASCKTTREPSITRQRKKEMYYHTLRTFTHEKTRTLDTHRASAHTKRCEQSQNTYRHAKIYDVQSTSTLIVPTNYNTTTNMTIDSIEQLQGPEGCNRSGYSSLIPYNTRT